MERQRKEAFNCAYMRHSTDSQEVTEHEVQVEGLCHAQHTQKGSGSANVGKAHICLSFSVRSVSECLPTMTRMLATCMLKAELAALYQNRAGPCEQP